MCWWSNVRVSSNLTRHSKLIQVRGAHMLRLASISFGEVGLLQCWWIYFLERRDRQREREKLQKPKQRIVLKASVQLGNWKFSHRRGAGIIGFSCHLRRLETGRVTNWVVRRNSRRAEKARFKRRLRERETKATPSVFDTRLKRYYLISLWPGRTLRFYAMAVSPQGELGWPISPCK